MVEAVLRVAADQRLLLGGAELQPVRVLHLDLPCHLRNQETGRLLCAAARTTKKNVKQFAKLYESPYSLANYMGVDIQNGKYLFCMSNSFICLPNGIIVCRTVCDCPYKMANTFLYGKLFD